MSPKVLMAVKMARVCCQRTQKISQQSDEEVKEGASLKVLRGKKILGRHFNRSPMTLQSRARQRRQRQAGGLSDSGSKAPCARQSRPIIKHAKSQVVLPSRVLIIRVQRSHSS